MEKYDLFVNEPENVGELKFVRVTVYEKIVRNIRNYWYVLSTHTHTHTHTHVSKLFYIFNKAIKLWALGKRDQTFETSSLVVWSLKEVVLVLYSQTRSKWNL